MTTITTITKTTTILSTNILKLSQYLGKALGLYLPETLQVRLVIKDFSQIFPTHPNFLSAGTRVLVESSVLTVSHHVMMKERVACAQLDPWPSLVTWLMLASLATLSTCAMLSTWHLVAAGLLLLLLLCWVYTGSSHLLSSPAALSVHLAKSQLVKSFSCLRDVQRVVLSLSNVFTTKSDKLGGQLLGRVSVTSFLMHSF